MLEKIFGEKFFALIKKEFISIWRDKKSRSAIFIPPVLQLFIFSHAATLDITNLKIGVLDKDNTEISREFIRQIQTSRYFSKIYFFKNEKEMKDLIDREKIRTSIYINNDFTKKYKSSNNPEILVVADGRRTNSSQIISSYIQEIAKNFSNIDKKREISPITTVVENSFNPNLSYRWFIIASLMGILPMTVVVLLSSLSLAREKEDGTFDELLILPVSPKAILFSKLLTCLIFGLLNGVIIIILSLIFFKIPFEGSFLLYFLSLIIFLSSVSGIGLFISTFAKTQQQAMLLVFVFMFPSIMLSGYTTPIENITPQFLQNLTIFNPLRFFLVISKGIILKNMNFYYVCLNLLPVLLISIFTISCSLRAFCLKVK